MLLLLHVTLSPRILCYLVRDLMRIYDHIIPSSPSLASRYMHLLFNFEDRIRIKIVRHNGLMLVVLPIKSNIMFVF